MGIVVMGAVFVDIKGFPEDIYIPDGRNVGHVEYIHGGVSRNVVEDIANIELRPTFVGIVDDSALGEEVVKKLGGKIPILGVCLGHQAICEAFGGRIEHAQQLMHGKQSIVEVDTDEPLFKGLAKKTMAARYHSLVAAPDALPACLKVISRDERGEIMAVRHKTQPIYGVQFHPESILTPQGKRIMENFLQIGKQE